MDAKQINLARKEIGQFIKAVSKKIKKLQDLNLLDPKTNSDHGEIFLRNKEVVHLRLCLAAAISYSHYYTEDFSEYASLLNDLSEESSDDEVSDVDIDM